MTITKIESGHTYIVEKGPSRELLFDTLRLGGSEIQRTRIELKILTADGKRTISVTVTGIAKGNDRVREESNAWFVWGEVKKQGGFQRPDMMRKGMKLHFLAHINTKNRRGKLRFRDTNPILSGFVPLELLFENI